MPPKSSVIASVASTSQATETSSEGIVSPVMSADGAGVTDAAAVNPGGPMVRAGYTYGQSPSVKAAGNHHSGGASTLSAGVTTTGFLAGILAIVLHL